MPSPPTLLPPKSHHRCGGGGIARASSRAPDVQGHHRVLSSLGRGRTSRTPTPGGRSAPPSTSSWLGKPARVSEAGRRQRGQCDGVPWGLARPRGSDAQWAVSLSSKRTAGPAHSQARIFKVEFHWGQGMGTAQALSLLAQPGPVGGRGQPLWSGRRGRVVNSAVASSRGLGRREPWSYRRSGRRARQWAGPEGRRLL